MDDLKTARIFTPKQVVDELKSEFGDDTSTNTIRNWEKEFPEFLPGHRMPGGKDGVGERYYTEQDLRFIKKIKQWRMKKYSVGAIREMLLALTQEDPDVSEEERRAMTQVFAADRQDNNMLPVPQTGQSQVELMTQVMGSLRSYIDEKFEVMEHNLAERQQQIIREEFQHLTNELQTQNLHQGAFIQNIARDLETSTRGIISENMHLLSQQVQKQRDDFQETINMTQNVLTEVTTFTQQAAATSHEPNVTKEDLQHVEKRIEEWADETTQLLYENRVERKLKKEANEAWDKLPFHERLFSNKEKFIAQYIEDGKPYFKRDTEEESK